VVAPKLVDFTSFYPALRSRYFIGKVLSFKKTVLPAVNPIFATPPTLLAPLDRTFVLTEGGSVVQKVTASEK